MSIPTVVYLLVIFAFSAGSTVLIMPLIIRLAKAYQLFDIPDVVNVSTEHGSMNIKSFNTSKSLRKRIHINPIPRLGGVAMVLAFSITLAFVALSVPVPNKIWFIFLPSLALFLIGLFDDVFSVSAIYKLAVQILISSLTVYLCHFEMTSISLTNDFVFMIPEGFGFALSVFIIVGAINSINMIDGMDGLASGMMLIGISLLTYLYFVLNQDFYDLLFLTIPLLGVLIGFLKYNVHPARIFMGDCGSNWLGFLAGSLILYVLTSSPKDAGNEAQVIKNLPLLSVIMCFALPVVDTAAVIFSRLLSGLNPMNPDNRHFHNTMFKLGLNQSQSVLAIYFFNVLFALIAIAPVLFVNYSFDYMPYLSFLALFAICTIGMKIDKKTLSFIQKTNIETKVNKDHFFLTKTLNLIEGIYRYLIYSVLLAFPIFSGTITQTMGYCALTMLICFIITKIFALKANDILHSVVICLSASVLLITNNYNVLTIQFDGQIINIQNIYNYIFILIAIMTGIIFLLTFRKKYLHFTPNDFLILLFPLLFILVDEPYKSQYKLEVIALRSIILFSALQLIIRRNRGFHHKINFVFIFSLALVSIIGIYGIKIVYQ